MCVRVCKSVKPLGRRPKIKSKGLKSNAQINLAFLSVCSIFSLLLQAEIRLRLGNIQINLIFRSPCTNFVPSNTKR